MITIRKRSLSLLGKAPFPLHLSRVDVSLPRFGFPPLFDLCLNLVRPKPYNSWTPSDLTTPDFLPTAVMEKLKALHESKGSGIHLILKPTSGIPPLEHIQ